LYSGFSFGFGHNHASGVVLEALLVLYSGFRNIALVVRHHQSKET
jgi:hypothetical protein